MSKCNELIPPPPVVREELAACLRQTSLLRRLLRLSVRAAEERQRRTVALNDRQPEATRPEAVAS
jgi:hypothetical protein